MIYDYYKEISKKSFKGQFFKLKYLIALVVFVMIVGAIIASNIYLKVIQLDEIGNLSSIYTKNLIYQILFSLGAFVLIFIAISASNIFIIKNMKAYFKENELEQRKMPNIPIALIIATIGAFACKNLFYQSALTYFNSTSFGVNAPIFNIDIGYFLFQRPFLMSIYEFISTLWMAMIVYTALYYVLMFTVAFSGNLSLEDFKVRSIMRHNLINIAIYFIIKAISYRFQKEGLVYSNFFDLKGAGFTDINVWMSYFTYIPFVLILIVLAAFIFIWKGNLKNAAITIVIYPSIWVLVVITSMIVQNFIVTPNEQNYEKEYVQNNMEMTREAYGINKVKSIPFEIGELTPEILNRNQDTKDNIRLVDYQSTLDSDIQLQSNTNFYTFNNGDIVNYSIKGKAIPVFITAREIDKSKIPEKSYINTTFRYTHGYGVVINPINQLSSQGQVDFYLSGLKMDNSVDPISLNVTEPRIYYGELTNDDAIVNPKDYTNLKEIDYDGSPDTDKNYDGSGGIKLTPLNRLLFAIKKSDLNMLISSNVSSDSRLLLNRQVVDRAQMAVPFLTIDKDPYILIDSKGKLKWVLDAYTTTNNFPYAQEYDGYNYIRNSVKIVIDAYSGKVKYYIIDKEDPIIQTYAKVYPKIFSNDTFPTDLASHMRYPEELFKVKTEILKRYHLDPKTQVGLFFSNQDMWNIAKYPDNSSSGGVRDIDPYYNMIKLSGEGENKEELILMRPFTPSGEKHNMVSWVAVRNNFENNGVDYGKMILYTFPKNTNILGPDQVEVNINQIGEISELMTLWNQSGSSVFKGSLLVIPIEGSVLYVEPIYIKSQSTSSIPQVRKIVVGYQKGSDFKHGIGDTLDDALKDLFAGISQTPVTTDTSNQPPANTGASENTTGNAAENERIIKDIQSKYDQMKKQLDELGSLLDKLNK